MPEGTADALVALFDETAADAATAPEAAGERHSLTGSRRCWPVIRSIAALLGWRRATGPTANVSFATRTRWR